MKTGDSRDLLTGSLWSYYPKSAWSVAFWVFVSFRTFLFFSHPTLPKGPPKYFCGPYQSLRCWVHGFSLLWKILCQAWRTKIPKLILLKIIVFKIHSLIPIRKHLLEQEINYCCFRNKSDITQIYMGEGRIKILFCENTEIDLLWLRNTVGFWLQIAITMTIFRLKFLVAYSHIYILGAGLVPIVQESEF